MKRLFLFLFFSLFVAAAANRAWACGTSGRSHAEKYQERKPASCCERASESNSAAHCSQDSGACDQAHPGESCPDDDDGCGGCHCPGCGTVASHAPAAFASSVEAIFPPFFDADSAHRQAFYFAEHMPEAVYLPIWQPPQLSA